MALFLAIPLLILLLLYLMHLRQHMCAYRNVAIPALVPGDVVFLRKRKLRTFFDYVNDRIASAFFRTPVFHAGLMVTHSTIANMFLQKANPLSGPMSPEGLELRTLTANGSGALTTSRFDDFIRTYHREYNTDLEIYRCIRHLTPWQIAEALKQYAHIRYSVLDPRDVFRGMDRAAVIRAERMNCVVLVGFVFEDLGLLPPSKDPLWDYVPGRIVGRMIDSNNFYRVEVA